MATIDRNSKADTIGLFYNGGGGAADLVADYSQYAANLTNGTTHLRSTDSRFAVRSPRELSMVASLSNTQTGILLNYGNTAGTEYMYRVDISMGVLYFRQNDGAEVIQVTAPGITGTASSYVIHWSTDYDPIAGSYYSEIMVVRVAASSYTITRATHAQPNAPGAGFQFNILGYSTGTSAWSGGPSLVTSVRVSNRFHSTTEAKEDWISQSSAPSPLGYEPPTELAPTALDFYTGDMGDDVADAILDTDTFAGPAEWLAVLHAGANRQRLYSPLLNVVFNNPPTLQNTWSPTNWWKTGSAIDSDTDRRYGIGHVFVCPCPVTPAGTALTARVRVHVQGWVAAGAPGGTTPRIDLRMRSSSEIVGDLGNVSLGNVVSYTTNDGSGGVGTWADLGEVVLAQSEGVTYLALGLDFSSGTGAAYRRAKIKAIEVDCYVEA